MIATYLKTLADFGKKQHPDLDWRYSSYEELVLDLGVSSTDARLEVSGPIKHCYMNAFMAAVENEGWSYVEGYAHNIIPVPHAWCLDEKGIVVETTWESVGTEYYGVPLSLDWVMRVAAEVGYWGIFTNDYKRDLVLLREGIPLEALIPEKLTSA